ncbi:hypothetical protein [Microbacterium sp. JZ101]
MEQGILRRDLAAQRRRSRRANVKRRGERLFYGAVVGGFLLGLVITAWRDEILPAQFHRDATRIFNIASGSVPDFTDRSYTPVGIAYRWLGLGNNPDAAAFAGYLFACLVIGVALLRVRRRTASVAVATFIVAAFALSGVYLGQYSKDVFVLVPVMLLLILPRRLWWDVLAVLAMAGYAYLFRDYWYLVAASFAAYRVITIWQARLRYLLFGGAVAAVGIGLIFYVLLGVDPNHYRTAVQGHLDANTLIIPVEPVSQPFGGAIDVFVNYWLLYAPILLPLTASLPYLAVSLAFVFVKLLPLAAARSAVRWPAPRSRDGVLLRRAISLMLALGVVQAVFEPDYGSALRHFTPLLALAIVLMQASRAGSLREGKSVPWSWSGRAASPARPSASETESPRQG